MIRLRITIALVMALICLSPHANAGSALLPDYPAELDLPPMPDVPTLSAAAIAKAQTDPELQQAYLLATGAAGTRQQGLDRVLRLAADGNVVAETLTCELLSQRDEDGDWPAAQTFCWRAARAGYPPASLLTGINDLYNSDPMIQRRSIQWLDLARRQGIVEAAVMLASFYQRGLNVDQDPEKAKALIAPLLQKTGAIELYARAVQYRRGIGVAIDLAKADIYLRQAAEKGDFRAQSDYAAILAAQEKNQPSLKPTAQGWWQRHLESQLTWVMTWRPDTP